MLASEILDALKNFSIIHFKDNKLPATTSPHYYLNVPVDDDSSILLCIITSQIDGQKNYYKRVGNTKAIDSLVIVDGKKVSCLTKECCIECNQAELINLKTFESRINTTIGLRLVATQESIPDNIKDRTIQAIKNSPRVKKFIQDLI